jgi:hypothetical protein
LTFKDKETQVEINGDLEEAKRYNLNEKIVLGNLSNPN